MPEPRKVSLTDRDREILEVLTKRIRVFSIAQVARIWWVGSKAPEAAATERLKRLQQAGVVELFSMFSHPEIRLSKPLAAWNPTAVVPDFGALSYTLSTRFSEPFARIPSVIASARTGREFGGHGGRKPRRAEQNHDLHFASVFLRIREIQPERIPFWQSEGKLKYEQEVGDKLPDAVVESPDELCAIELGGEYSKAKLEAFHDFCAGRQMSYEIW